MSLPLLSKSISILGRGKLLTTTSLSFRSSSNWKISSNNQFRYFSSATPVKKDAHGHGVESHGNKGHGVDKHGHGHGEHGVAERPAPTHNHPQEHLFEYQEGDYVPPTETHAVGDEKDEIDFGPFDSSVLEGGFGTKEKPVNVHSRYGQRIVGCTGSAEQEHELLWHEVKANKDLVCMDCGQFFRLKQIPGLDLGHGHGHHEESEFHGHKDGDGFRFIYPPKSKAQVEEEAKVRAEELKKDPKSTPKKSKPEGVDYHAFEEGSEEGRLTSKAPVFHDRRPQPFKDRQ